MTNNKIDIHSIAVGNKIRIKSKMYGVLEGIATYVESEWFRLDSGYSNRPLDFSDIEWAELISSFVADTQDLVNHPAHYQSETGLETIDVIEAFTFDLKGIEAVCTGNILKYMCRWSKKNGLEDLKKARRYLEMLINHVEKLEEENK